MIYKKIIYIVFLLLIIFRTGAEEELVYTPDIPTFSVSPGSIKIFGTTLRFTFNAIPLLQDINAGLVLEIGGGYWDNFYFLQSDGTEWTPPLEDMNMEEARYKVVDLSWGVGICERFIHGPGNKNLNVYLLYRGEYVSPDKSVLPSSLFYTTNSPEQDGIVRHSLYLGGIYSDVDIFKLNQTKEGFVIEAGMNVGFPYLIGSNSSSWFYKVSSNIRGFYRILGGNTVAMYLGDRFSIDYVTGEYIPLFEYQSFGALDPYLGIGWGVGGIAPGRFMGNLKMMNNFDIRISFPSLFGFYFFPGIILQFDVGLSDNRTGILNLDDLQYSTGAGIWISLFNFSVIFNFSYHINEKRFSSSCILGLRF